MNYVNALLQATTRMSTAGVHDEIEAQAALRLACLPFERADEVDRPSALLRLDILTVLAELYPSPAPVVIAEIEPSIADPAARAAWLHLVLTIAAGYQQASAQPGLSSGRRFAYAAAASRLRAAVRRMA